MKPPAIASGWVRSAVGRRRPVPGCAIDAAIDCDTICNRYKTCFDGNYDVAACATRCRSHSDTDTAYRRAANTCNACITNRACASATFVCGTECSSMIP
ncbi:MAG: hypothetical protein WCJ30_15820 [Deltaproteobacteria bacterium]